MKTIGDIFKIGAISLIVFVSGGINAWAVESYPLSPEIENADKVQAEKQEIIKKIENLKEQDPAAIKEIGNDLKQMEEKDSNSLSKDEAHGGNGLNMFGFILFFIVVIGLSTLLYGKRE
jgi:hypothetical protein